jgi:tryptophan synthase beta chain
MTDGEAEANAVPSHWYNIAADLPFELPADLPPPGGHGSSDLKPQVPLTLIRQSLSRERNIPIPAEVRDRYRLWRPTPLVRARRLEASLGTSAQIYYKHEGNNASGSHKLNTALAQAYYYNAGGAKRLTTGTGAGQWGTALAIGCDAFGMGCKVYMVGSSFRQKPYRKTIMQLYGAEVVASPSPDTKAGARLLSEGRTRGANIAFAMTEALEDALSTDGSQLCVGSGEAYSILHQTVIGIEAKNQLAALGHTPDIVIGCLGAGSNFGGIAFPFLQDQFRASTPVRCISVEPSACAKLTRGVYRYDYTDNSGITPLQRMYTLGHLFRTPELHAGGLRYHACSKLVSALYHHRIIEAVAYSQIEVFTSAVLFSRTEGMVPAPEAAHAVHAAIREAIRARQEGSKPVILFCLSGHGLFDMAAYGDYLDGRLEDTEVSDSEIDASIAALPAI